MAPRRRRLPWPHEALPSRSRQSGRKTLKGPAMPTAPAAADSHGPSASAHSLLADNVSREPMDAFASHNRYIYCQTQPEKSEQSLVEPTMPGRLKPRTGGLSRRKQCGQRVIPGWGLRCCAKAARTARCTRCNCSPGGTGTRSNLHQERKYWPWSGHGIIFLRVNPRVVWQWTTLPPHPGRQGEASPWGSGHTSVQGHQGPRPPLMVGVGLPWLVG